MAILTNFLKLLKPEKNDYVDVDKHISENYDKIDSKMQELNSSNSGKLDKGAVSSEYDTAKKIEDKIKIAQNTANDKLNKDGYNGTAQTLKNDIDGKVSKSGDTMTGSLTIKSNLNHIECKDSKNAIKVHIGYSENNSYAFMYNNISSNQLKLYDDGRTELLASNLVGEAKDVITAINNSNFKQNIQINNASDLDNIPVGVYSCYMTDNAMRELNFPEEVYPWGYIECYGEASTGKLFQRYTSHRTNAQYGNTTFIRKSFSNNTSRVWLEWQIIPAYNHNFKFLGSATKEGQRVSYESSSCSEFLILCQYYPNAVCGTYLFTKNMIENEHIPTKYIILGNEAGKAFECDFTIDKNTKSFILNGPLAGNDGGIHVYAR